MSIEAAKKRLESGDATVTEAMHAVGYTDVKAFREVFKRLTGLSPFDYRTEYNKAFSLLAR